MQIQPVTLEGQRVKLEPLTLEHHGSLCEVGLDPALWRLTTTQIHSSEDMRRYIEAALKEQTQGTALPFVIVDRSASKAVGSTRYGNIDGAHRRLEIGWTWVARPWQRTSVNTEAKYLLLKHAFETLGCIRVEFKTDSLNQQSRTALLRIGATEEGVFRNHMITESGRIRHSVYYSIIDSEWLAIRSQLEEKLLISRGVR